MASLGLVVPECVLTAVAIVFLPSRAPLVLRLFAATVVPTAVALLVGSRGRGA
jgi:hypothetical protein